MISIILASLSAFLLILIFGYKLRIAQLQNENYILVEELAQAKRELAYGGEL